MPKQKTEWGPFETLQHAEGFAEGVEYAASFTGEFDGPFPEVTGEPFVKGGEWFVTVELEVDEDGIP